MAKLMLIFALTLLEIFLISSADNEKDRGWHWGVHHHEDRRYCTISLSQHALGKCKLKRVKELTASKMFYKFTEAGAIKYPHLDQPVKTTLGYFMTERFHAHWFNLYFSVMLKNSANVIKASIAKNQKAKMTKYSDYFKISKEFQDETLKATNYLPYFKYASRSYKYFTDVKKNGRFKEDKYFVQMRLAGPNPMAIKRVVLRGSKVGTHIKNLGKRLNKAFNWGKAVTSITKDKSIWQSIGKKKVYVVEHQMLDGVPTMPDILAYDRPNMKMRSAASPIALFAVDPKKRLKIVAIQISNKPDGQVYTPKDGIKWQVSKAQLELNDIFVSEVVEHLLKTHFRMEPLCIAINRHLSKMHPLHQILKHHCRGLLPVNANGVIALFNGETTLRSLFPYGNKGAVHLMNKEALKMVWNDIDLEVNLRERGMNDRKQMPYYPYRDDGRKINDALQGFAENLIDAYYEWNSFVRKDQELQNMIKELSSKVKGVPRKFETKQQLKTFIRQTLWIIVQHSVFNYAGGHFSETPVVCPTKLYESKIPGGNKSYIDMLPGPVSSVLQASLSTLLSTLHYDSLFDYWENLTSPKLRNLVREAYEDMKVVEKHINYKNKRRFNKGLLTNPFMVPSWMPNSIST